MFIEQCIELMIAHMERNGIMDIRGEEQVLKNPTHNKINEKRYYAVLTEDESSSDLYYVNDDYIVRPISDQDVYSFEPITTQDVADIFGLVVEERALYDSKALLDCVRDCLSMIKR